MEECAAVDMPYPDPRDLTNASVGSSVRPRAAMRDLRASQTLTVNREMSISGDALRVYPAEVEFKDTSPNVPHILTMTIMNKSDHVKRVRLVPIAPGLEISVDVEYLSPLDQDFKDEIQVLCDSDCIRVPVYARKAAADIRFEQYCNFGSVSPGSHNIRYVDIINHGSKAADFEFVADSDLSFAIEPMVGRLGPAGTEDCCLRLKVSLKANDVALLRNILRLNVDGQPRGQILDINALVTKHSIEILSQDGTGKVDFLQFGSLYCGERRDFEVLVLNDGPTESEVRVSISADTEDKAQGWVITPNQMLMQAREQRLVTVTFCPPLVTYHKGFKTQLLSLSHREEYEAIVTLQGKGSGDLLNSSLRVLGRSFQPSVSLSHNDLCFLDTPTHGNRELTATIKNEHDEMPVLFSIPRIPHFKCRPSAGTLLPMQSMELVLSFSPNQLGRHRGAFVISFKGTSKQVVETAELRVVGRCDQVGSKRDMVGGPLATDVDFAPKFHFQHPDDAHKVKASKKKFSRQLFWQQHPPEYNERTAHLTHDAETFEKIWKNRVKYADFLSNAHSKRMKVETFPESFQFALGNQDASPDLTDPDYQKPSKDMGMFGLPMAGIPSHLTLQEPQLKMPKEEEALYLKSSTLKGTLLKPRTLALNEDRLISKKFKSAPSSKQEKLDCQVHLQPQDILCISTFPPSMDFGSICIQADVSKSFFVSNNTSRNILVRIDTDGNSALSRSKPTSQVIPPSATAGFDITIYLESQADISTKFRYVINEHHAYEVAVKAEAVPVMLHVSKTRINFSFPPTSMEPVITESFHMTNPSNNAAQYKIEQGEHFKTFPSDGIVEPMSTEEIMVTYRPGQECKHEQTLSISVTGGAIIPLLCSGEVEESHAQLKQKSIDMGVVSAGQVCTRSFALSCTGGSSTAFFIDTNEMRARAPGLTVTPEKGLVTPGTNSVISVSVKSDRSVKIDDVIIIQIRGSKTLRVTVKAEVILPRVEIKEDEIDFGTVYIGAVAVRSIQLQNLSSITARLFLDLRRYPEFSVTLPEVWDYDTVLAKRDEEEAEEEAEISQLRPGELTNFRIPPKDQGTLTITYAPTKLSKHAIELPLGLQDISSSTTKNLRRVLLAEAKKPRLLLSTTSLEFSKRVVVNANMKGVSYVMTLQVTHCDDHPSSILAYLDGPDAKAGSFRMERVEAHLDHRKSLELKVHFVPTSNIEYDCELLIFLNSEPSPYFSVHVHGTGTFPRLEFDRREVLLPTTPCGIPSEVTFFIINHGYDNLDIKYKLPADTAVIPLSFSFPLGTITSVMRTRIPVQVSFTYPKSLSFSSKVCFFDDHGNEFSILIAGRTDACFLSVFPFITLHGADCKILPKSGKGPTAEVSGTKMAVMSKEGTIELEEKEEVKSRQRLADLIPNNEFLCECSVLAEPSSKDLLVKWINLSLLRQPMQRFPEELIKSKGRQLVQLVETFTGKSILPKDKTSQARRTPANRKEEAEEERMWYEEFLAFLKTSGALIDVIRPEYLLHYDLFQKLVLDKSSESYSEEQHKYYDRYYELINTGSWLLLTYQVIKLFSFNRITPSLVRSMPMVDAKTIKLSSQLTSNVYSNSELLLLSWLAYHNERMVPTEKANLLNFDLDLHDGRVIAYLISSHVPSLKSMLSGLKRADDRAQQLSNIHNVSSAIRHIGLPFSLEPSHFVEAPARDLILFCMYLFENLPGFVPKALVEFDGCLNETVTRSIELKNPSNKQLVYSVHVDGSSEFVCAKSVKMLPGKKTVFPISITHSSRKTAEGQIYFIGEQMAGNTTGATLVFTLRSVVKSFKRSEVMEREAKLYEQVLFEIPVLNDTDVDTEVQVTLSNFKDSMHEDLSSSKNRGQKVRRGKGGDMVTSSALLPERTFWLRNGQDKLKVKRNSSINAKVLFLPMRLSSQSCLVFVKDAEEREVCYELRVRALLPSTTESYKFTNPMKSVILKEISLTTRNASVDKCRALIMDMLGQQGVDYKVEYLSSFFSGPSQLSLVGSGSARVTAAAKDGKGAGDGNKLALELRPQGPGRYEGKVILRSALDVRVIEVEAVVSVPSNLVELTFSCPARQSITQEIPIINYTETPWSVEAKLSGSYFSGSRELTVPAAASSKEPGRATFALTFSPRWICSVEGELVLHNHTIDDSYKYQLTGVGEDPVAEDHLVVDCKARWRRTLSIPVRNLLEGKNCNYKVECDLMGVSGASQFLVPSKSVKSYELFVLMPRGGTFKGSITFTAPNNEYVWFTLEVNANNPPPEQTLELRTRARTAVAADIPIVNPTPEEVTFDVLLNGEGLLGQPSVTLAPSGTTTYELIYSPLIAGGRQGSLTFINDEMGEFWYEIKLMAGEPEVMDVPSFSCSLGRSIDTQVSIENPLPDDVMLLVDNSNPVNFTVTNLDREEERAYLIPAFSSSSFLIAYTPAALGEEERGRITFSHPQAGKWEFAVSGTGGPPEMFAAVEVSAAVGEMSSNVVTFKNPLKRDLVVNVSLRGEEEEEEGGCFSLVGSRSTNLHVPSLKSIDIPFTFFPKKMTEHRCVLRLSCQDLDLSFDFPIHGTAESPETTSLGRFACRSRERLVKEIVVELEGAGEAVSSEDVSFELLLPDEHQSLLRKALRFTRDQTVADPSKCHFTMVFEPLKPIQAKVQLRVTRPSGGRWLYDLDVVAEQAEVDDEIMMEGSLNRVNTVSFKMTNQFDEPASFHAFFSLDSSPEFQVSPSQGMLSPYGSEGTTFLLSFSPKTYGRSYRALLIIETDEMQWTYRVVGEPPKYRPPKPKASGFKTRISPELDPDVYKGRLPPTNYMRDNAAAVRQAGKQGAREGE
ncbi:hypothetical protein GUITHDRAFT_116187 [Guillardia theta CCMP2712]|uniref:Calponin-homology (CH) domain-containing protein n=1 Tax=Guillardia theta (strain CCMP2712) TaxID=905079 RepID=L1IN49_GUITC|nr:hypothetical protein GUITHDRAFT_116187 [Guillardia theta CCMP2712]EKX37711.1 hypothetical protein GUITHDRAFT_116187 [Guillardia theta CCMP2712]|eukprot:XP_005824691.1 hypothetical protein GUITHDRAFT_116187 [Guillardia theta CCMP2712]